jgi:hypothetical protein
LWGSKSSLPFGKWTQAQGQGNSGSSPSSAEPKSCSHLAPSFFEYQYLDADFYEDSPASPASASPQSATQSAAADEELQALELLHTTSDGSPSAARVETSALAEADATDDMAADIMASQYAESAVSSSRKESADWGHTIEQMIQAFRNQTLSYVSRPISFSHAVSQSSPLSASPAPVAVPNTPLLSSSTEAIRVQAEDCVVSEGSTSDFTLLTAVSVSAEDAPSAVTDPSGGSGGFDPIVAPAPLAETSIQAAASPLEAVVSASPSRRPQLPPRLSVAQQLATQAHSLTHVLKLSAIWRHSQAMNLVVLALTGFKHELDDLREVINLKIYVTSFFYQHTRMLFIDLLLLLSLL